MRQADNFGMTVLAAAFLLSSAEEGQMAVRGNFVEVRMTLWRTRHIHPSKTREKKMAIGEQSS